jgi:catechol 2,3-dioxygenase-like lactoylglutathione lyase family enzyme
LLRAAFFANLYITPLLLGEVFHPQDIWYSGADGQPMAAREYAARYGRLWESRPDALLLLKELWNDPIVRAELRSFINLSRNLLNARESELEDRLRERDSFLNPARLERTQSEILAKLAKANLKVPAAKPRLSLVLLASRDPASSTQFYRKLLGIEPTLTSQSAGGYAEFYFEGVRFAIHGQDRTAARDPFLLGPPPSSFGWGAIFVFRVSAFDRYYENASTLTLEIVDSDLATKGRRYFVVKDPSGYLIEVTEEDPKGLESA